MLLTTSTLCLACDLGLWFALMPSTCHSLGLRWPKSVLRSAIFDMSATMARFGHMWYALDQTSHELVCGLRLRFWLNRRSPLRNARPRKRRPAAEAARPAGVAEVLPRAAEGCRLHRWSGGAAGCESDAEPGCDGGGASSAPGAVRRARAHSRDEGRPMEDRFRGSPAAWGASEFGAEPSNVASHTSAPVPVNSMFGLASNNIGLTCLGTTGGPMSLLRLALARWAHAMKCIKFLT